MQNIETAGYRAIVSIYIPRYKTFVYYYFLYDLYVLKNNDSVFNEWLLEELSSKTELADIIKISLNY